MKLIWTRLANLDRQAIPEHVAQDNPVAALVLDEVFSAKADHLARHPRLGRSGRMAGTRELIAHHNYIIIYDVVDDTVRLLRVLHAARQWPPKR